MIRIKTFWEKIKSSGNILLMLLISAPFFNQEVKSEDETKFNIFMNYRGIYLDNTMVRGRYEIEGKGGGGGGKFFTSQNFLLRMPL